MSSRQPVIVVAEDDAASRYGIVRVLNRAGFHTREAATGTEALRLAADSPDLIFLGVNLPDISGLEVCRRLKADPATAAVTVVHLSADRTRGEDRASGLDSDADGFLLAPVEPKELLATVRATLRARRAEEALRASEERFRSAFTHAAVGMALTDLEGRFLQANAAYCAITGYTEGELLATDFAAITHPDDREASWRAVRRLLAEEVPGFDLEKRYVRKDGGVVWVHNSAALVRDGRGRPGNFIILSQDVTDRKRDAEALRVSEGRLRRLAESGVLGLISGDAEGNITEANDVFLDLVGYSREDLLAGRIRWTELTPPEYLPFDERGIAEARRRGICRPYEKEYVRKDGRRVPVLIGYALVEGSHDEFVCFILDLSERKRLEKELRRRNAQLQEADRRKDDFLAVLGHELRNPLGPLRNALEVLRLRGDDPSAVGWVREVGRRQVRQLSRLVDDLLDVSRVGRDKLRLQRARLDLVPLVRAAAEDHRAALADARLALDVSLPPAPVWVEGDAARLTQAVDNLLTNAGKFTDPGGRVAVRLEADAAAGRATVAVRDTGIGIEPEMLPRLFDAFAQSARSLDRSRGGLGVGLALVKGLAEMHGGGVGADSAGPGRGAEVRFWLPLAPPPAPAAEDAGPATAGMTPLKILVIEDGPDAAESLRLLLELTGHQVRLAAAGPDGVEAARQWRPDVVLCDLALPGMDGFAVARALRADPALADARLIAVSGYGREEDRQRGRESGFDGHLIKPLDFAELRRLLGEVRPPAD